MLCLCDIEEKPLLPNIIDGAISFPVPSETVLSARVIRLQPVYPLGHDHAG